MTTKKRLWLACGLGALALGACGPVDGDGDGTLLAAGIEVGDPQGVIVDPFVLPGEMRPWAPPEVEPTPVGAWCDSRAPASGDACRLCENTAAACLAACDFGSMRGGAPVPMGDGECGPAPRAGCVRAGMAVCEDARLACAECGVCNRLGEAVPGGDPSLECEMLWDACDADCALTGGAACTLCQVRVGAECGPRG
jgi:hypothetical protein